MKTLTSLLIASILSLTTYSQELMTIGEVFDFEIGDEFQIRGSATGQPPNADWITIIAKEYSTEGDTVFYHRYHDSYFIYKKGDFTCGIPDLTVGIMEADKIGNEFLVFPNPATSVLNIENKSMNTGFSFVLQNSIGRQVMAAGLHGQANKLDISNLSPGIYLLQIHDSNGTVFNQKILKQD